MRKSYADAVKDMPDAEAVTFLLGVLDRDIATFNQRKCDVLNHLGSPAIAHTPLAVLICLWDRRGGVVAYDSLCAVAEFESGVHNKCVTNLGLAAHVKRIRRAAKRYGWPITVTVVNSIGYRLELTRKGWSIE